jgi:predicted AAA+ superfamily ATPase
MLHNFLGISALAELERHPRLGASWEGFMIETIRHLLGARSRDCYYWRTHTGAELDLLIVHGARRYGFEIKRTVAPRITPSIRSVLEDLDLTRLDIIHSGPDTFFMAKNVRAVASVRILQDLAPLRKL